MSATRLATIVLLATFICLPLVTAAEPAHADGIRWHAAPFVPEHSASERLRDLLFRLEHEMHALKHEIRALRLRLDGLGAKIDE